MKKTLLYLSLAFSTSAFAQTEALKNKTNEAANKIEAKVIAWRRDFHEHPELGNNEFRTAGIIAKHLQSLGMEVKTDVAKTGVVAILKGITLLF
jgi:metal-dependent amidase/aminoacylase/carboxypeptidase family protein